MKQVPLSRPVLGWALFDFANSAYATSIITAIFSVYFVSFVVPEGGLVLGKHIIPAVSVWSYLVTSVMVVVVLLAPFLGRLADQRALKHRFMLVWTLVGAAGTMLLFGAKPGHLVYGCIFAFFSFLAYEMTLIFYNAFLNDVADRETTGRVSGLGFALGYMGGGLCLLLNMFMLAKPAFFGLASTDTSLAPRASFLVVGAWWLVFSIPTFLWVKDKPATGANQKITPPVKQLISTVKKAASQKNIGKFLLAYILYNDGIQTFILMASIFGSQVLGMTLAQLSLCILMIQFVAFLGALLFGQLADKWSHKKSILVTLVIYSFVACWAVFIQSQTEFWVMGVIVGIILGGSQAASRSFYARMVPKGAEGEFFSVYSIVGKAAAVLGPLMFGVVTQFLDLRMAVGSLILFFVGGGLILLLVKSSS